MLGKEKLNYHKKLRTEIYSHPFCKRALEAQSLVFYFKKLINVDTLLCASIEELELVLADMNTDKMPSFTFQEQDKMLEILDDIESFVKQARQEAKINDSHSAHSVAMKSHYIQSFATQLLKLTQGIRYKTYGEVC